MKCSYNTYILPGSNYKLVDLNKVFNYSYNEHTKSIYDNNITNKSVIKKYFYHIYLFNICKCITENNNKYLPILVFDIKDQTLTKDECKLFYKFLKMFPVGCVEVKHKFDLFIESLQDLGIKEEVLNIIQSNKQKNLTKKYYFSKIEIFCQRYDLTFLNKKFFGDIKNKMLMI